MGKGDKRSKKGKRIIGTSGVTRQKPDKSTASKPKAKKTSKADSKKSAKAAASDNKDLNKMTVAELKALAKEKELIGYSSMKKAELVKALS